MQKTVLKNFKNKTKNKKLHKQMYVQGLASVHV